MYRIADGLERCWLTLLPYDYTDNESYPLVVDMHGYANKLQHVQLF